jgi:hypothetical protein
MAVPIGLRRASIACYKRRVSTGSKTVDDHLARLAASRLQHERRIREMTEELTDASGFDQRNLEGRIRARVLRIKEIDRRVSRLRGNG